MFSNRPVLYPLERESDRRDSSFYEDRLWTDAALLSEDCEEMQRRLRYSRLEACNAEFHYPIYLVDERMCVRQILADFCYFLVLKYDPLDWGRSVFEDCNTFAEEYMRNKENPLRVLPRRLVLVTKVLHLLTRLKISFWSCDKYVNCLRLLFCGVKDPFVSLSEIRKFIISFEPFIPRGRSLNLPLPEIAENACETLKQLYPEMENPYKPRSLQHLGRCAIREHQKDIRRPVHRIVHNLPLPTKLKMYLLGLEPEVSRWH